MLNARQISLLHEEAWFIKSLAVELRITTLNHQRSHVQRIVNLLLNEPTNENAELDHMTEYGEQRSEFDFMGEKKRKILQLLDSVDFVEKAMPPLELQFFDQVAMEEAIASCTEKVWFLLFVCACFYCFCVHVGSVCCWSLLVYSSLWNDEVAEWLRRWTANPLCSARVGSNPILVDFFFYYYYFCTYIHVHYENSACDSFVSACNFLIFIHSQDEMSGCGYTDVKALHHLLVTELGTLDGPGAAGQRRSVLEVSALSYVYAQCEYVYFFQEIHEILAVVVSRNRVLECNHANRELFESWRQLVEVCLHSLEQAGVGREVKVAVLFELVQDLLLKVHTPLHTLTHTYTHTHTLSLAHPLSHTHTYMHTHTHTHTHTPSCILTYMYIYNYFPMIKYMHGGFL